MAMTLGEIAQYLYENGYTQTVYKNQSIKAILDRSITKLRNHVRRADNGNR